MVEKTINTPDGGHLIGGSFTTYKGITSNRIVKITATGSIDPSFVIGSGFNNHVYAMVATPDNGYLIGGVFTTYNGTNTNRIVKITATGSIDPSFLIGTGFVGTVAPSVETIINTPDGGYLIGGLFTTYKGLTQSGIVKVTATGSIDPSFVTGSGFNATVRIISSTPDDGYLIGGDFTIFNGTNRNRIVKITATGSIDPSFVIGSGFNGPPLNILNTPDNAYLIAGDFTEYNGTNRNKTVKLTSIGSIDPSFSDPNVSIVESIVSTTDNGYLMTGFASYNGLLKITSIGSIWPTSDYQAFLLEEQIQNTYNNLVEYNSGYGITYSIVMDTVRMIYEFNDQEIVIISDVYDTFDYVEVRYVNESLTIADVIQEVAVRSPYLIISNTATFSSVNYKIRVYEGSIFDGPSQSISYDITKDKLFIGQSNIYVNINNLVRERLEADITTFNDDTYLSSQLLPTNMSKWVLIDETTFDGSVTQSFNKYYLHALDGYLYNYEEQGSPNVFINGNKRYIHKNQSQRIYFQTNFLLSVSCSVDPDGNFDFEPTWDATDILGDNKKYIQSFKVFTDYFGPGTEYIDYIFTYKTDSSSGGGSSYTITKRFEIYNDCLYDLYTVVYKNKFGVLESIPFSRKSVKSLEAKGVDYERSILDYNGNYDITRHTSKQYNVNGYESWTLNTNWMPEYMNEAFEELGLSEEVWIITENDDIIPVVKEDTRIDFKTKLNDKLIQYTMKVKMSHQVIKNIL